MEGRAVVIKAITPPAAPRTPSLGRFGIGAVLTIPKRGVVRSRAASHTPVLANSAAEERET